jgi:hypothetical protein
LPLARYRVGEAGGGGPVSGLGVGLGEGVGSGVGSGVGPGVGATVGVGVGLGLLITTAVPMPMAAAPPASSRIVSALRPAAPAANPVGDTMVPVVAEKT